MVGIRTLIAVAIVLTVHAVGAQERKLEWRPQYAIGDQVSKDLNDAQVATDKARSASKAGFLP